MNKKNNHPSGLVRFFFLIVVYRDRELRQINDCRIFVSAQIQFLSIHDILNGKFIVRMCLLMAPKKYVHSKINW